MVLKTTEGIVVVQDYYKKMQRPEQYLELVFGFGKRKGDRGARVSSLTKCAYVPVSVCHTS